MIVLQTNKSIRVDSRILFSVSSVFLLVDFIFSLSFVHFSVNLRALHPRGFNFLYPKYSTATGGVSCKRETNAQFQIHMHVI